MPQPDQTIIAGQLLLADDPQQRCRLAPGYVRIRDGVIEELVEGEVPASADRGDANSLICPGFIDAHLHLPQFNIIGAHGMPLLRWLNDVTFPAEMKWNDVDFARAMTKQVARQLLSVGTTAVAAYATVHHESTIAAIETLRDEGIMGIVGQVLMDREAPPVLCRPCAQLLDEAARLVELFPPGQKMAAAMTPRFAITCTEELLIGAGRLASQSGSHIQTHLAETARECRLVRQLFDGRSYAELYDQCGLVTERSIHGHGIHIGNPDRQTFAQRHAVIAHCPTANTFLKSGTMSLAALRRAGVRVALGSDIGAGYERSMVRVARAMIEAAAMIGDPSPDVGFAWHAITAGNADALGWPDAGRLRSGAAADILVIQPDIDWLSGQVDPLALLMFAWDDRWVKTVVR